jgi:hypothetical protein
VLFAQLANAVYKYADSRFYHGSHLTTPKFVALTVPKLAKELKETRLTDPVFLVSLGVDMDLRAMGFDGTTIVFNRSDNIDDLWRETLTSPRFG